MSAEALKSKAAASPSAPVFVLHQHYRRYGRKCKSNGDNRKKWFWDWVIPTLTFSKCSSLVLIVLAGLLCSCAASDGPSFTSKNNGDFPKFDVNDLANLMDMFPEFRQYVLKVLTNYAVQQRQSLQNSNNNALSMPNTTPSEIADEINSRQIPELEERRTSVDKHDYYSYGQYDDYHPQPTKHSHKGYDYLHDDYHLQPSKYSYKGYDHHHDKYHPQPSKYFHKSHGYKYGWPSHEDHHHHVHKDPHFHYQVGYELGKDVSCVLGLLGFKSWKDFTFHSVISLLKKLKYVVLIGLAFKFGVILSPVALPLLFPVIILGAIIKILPILLVVILLFKLLKTQLKLGFKEWGRDHYHWRRDDSGGSNLLEGTQLSRLWRSIEDVTDTVVDSESCVEKVICNISRNNRTQNYNESMSKIYDGRAIGAGRSSFLEVSNFILQRTMDWFMPSHSWRRADIAHGEDDDGDASRIECEKIPCSIAAFDTEIPETNYKST